MVVDVIVVGGSLSGMSAAYDLHQAGKSVIVLEARVREAKIPFIEQSVRGIAALELGKGDIRHYNDREFHDLWLSAPQESSLIRYACATDGTSNWNRACPRTLSWTSAGS